VIVLASDREVELFRKTLHKRGVEKEISLLAEEAGELSVAALHLNREDKCVHKAWEQFVSEIADVEIMLDKMKHCFPSLIYDIERHRELKINRLAENFGDVPLTKG
jgi:hypothetical protein